MGKLDFSFNWEKLAQISAQIRGGEISAAGAAAHYLLLHLQSRHGSKWLSGPRGGRPAPTPTPTPARAPKPAPAPEPAPEPKPTPAGRAGVMADWEALGVGLTSRLRQRLDGVTTVEQLWRQFFFRGVVLDAHEGLVGWLEARYPLEMRTDIPSPDEMLEIQCHGRRYVSLLLKPPQQFVRYGRHRDAADFLLHDFEHAHKFFAGQNMRKDRGEHTQEHTQTHTGEHAGEQNGEHIGQVRFFTVLRQGGFGRWTRDRQFEHELNYLKADMNSHPVHLLKYLKAVVLNAEIRRSGRCDPDLDGFWQDLFCDWKMTPAVLDAALRLNMPSRETERDRKLIRDFFVGAYPVDKTASPSQI